jgi:transposase
MIPVPLGVRVWLAVGHTDMRRGMNSLAIQVQQGLKRDPHAGDLYVFRGRRGHLVKILWHDGIGMSLYAKRLGARPFYLAVAGRRDGGDHLSSAGPCCGGKLAKLGEDITETLEVVPRQWKVMQTIQEKFTCRILGPWVAGIGEDAFDERKGPSDRAQQAISATPGIALTLHRIPGACRFAVN